MYVCGKIERVRGIYFGGEISSDLRGSEVPVSRTVLGFSFLYLSWRLFTAWLNDKSYSANVSAMKSKFIPYMWILRDRFNYTRCANTARSYEFDGRSITKRMRKGNGYVIHDRSFVARVLKYCAPNEVAPGWRNYGSLHRAWGLSHLMLELEIFYTLIATWKTISGENCLAWK